MRANAMIPRFGGRIGEYMWEKEQERYKDRPWELQSKQSQGNPLFSLLFICLGILTFLLLVTLY